MYINCIIISITYMLYSNFDDKKLTETYEELHSNLHTYSTKYASLSIQQKELEKVISKLNDELKHVADEIRTRESETIKAKLSQVISKASDFFIDSEMTVIKQITPRNIDCFESSINRIMQIKTQYKNWKLTGFEDDTFEKITFEDENGIVFNHFYTL